MRSTFVELGGGDQKAKDHLLESLAICAHHSLSKKLLERFSNATGPMFAIGADWIPLDRLIKYEHGWTPPKGSPPYDAGDLPRDRLVGFVQKHLQSSRDAIVVCENFGAERRHIAKWPWPPPRIACFGDDEVYHLVTPDITDPDLIEAAVVSRHHWQTGVCSSCARVPEEDIPNEEFLDEIVENTKHIFVPAFDDSGYIIWTPRRDG